MKKLLAKISWPHKRSQQFLVLCLLIISVINVIVFQWERKRIHTFKQFLPHQIIGYKFTGLEEVVRGVEYIGYYTDQNINRKNPAKLFSQAQYILAPSILDFNNLEHEYVLFVCSDEKVAREKIKEIGAVAIRRNKYGMILAQRSL